MGLTDSVLAFDDAAVVVLCSLDALTIGYSAMTESPPPDANSSLYG